MDDSFIRGAELALQVHGIKDKQALTWRRPLSATNDKPAKFDAKISGDK